MVIKPTSVQAVCPARVDFTGGFTYVLPFRAKQWVTHVNLAIDLPVSVAIETIEDKAIQIKDGVSNYSESFPSCESIPDNRFSLIKTALRKFSINDGICIATDSNAPSGAGLGTSGALTVALVAALTALTGKTSPKRSTDLAALGAEVEQRAGGLAGLQDQFAAAVGGLNAFRFYNSKHSMEPVHLSDHQSKEMERHIFILYPGGKRHSTDIVTDVMNAYSNGDLATNNALNSLNSLAPGILSALKSMDWARLSALLAII